MYKIVNVFGRNTLSSDGPGWKRQRKIISPGFSERNNARVWELGLGQGQKMLEYWASKEGSNIFEMNVGNTALDTATLALHIICGAGFGVPQIWPNENESALEDKKWAGLNTKKPAKGHKLTFKESLVSTTSPQIFWLGIFPEWVLRKSPFMVHRKLFAARDDCMFYFKELIEQKRRYRRMGLEQDATDLISPLVKASDDAELATAEGKGTSQDEGLTENEITGNTFIIMFARHETTANVLHFSFLFLAIYLAAQRHLQSDIDNIVGTRPSSYWSYQVDMRICSTAWLGECFIKLFESCRQSFTSPRSTAGDRNNSALTERKSQFLEMAHISTWKVPLFIGAEERWLQKTPHSSLEEMSNKQVDGLGVASFEVHGSLFRPVKGAYMPFSEGPRACPGRRFAEVEVTAVLASVFKQYSIELGVRMWVSDEELDKISKKQKRDIYAKAQDRARKLIGGSQMLFTLKMEGDKVPVRFVKMGKERFADLEE